MTWDNPLLVILVSEKLLSEWTKCVKWNTKTEWVYQWVNEKGFNLLIYSIALKMFCFHPFKYAFKKGETNKNVFFWNNNMVYMSVT